MTRDEWETIALLIENCWRGEFDDTRSTAYFTLLKDFNHGDLMTALNVLMEEGKPFVPSAPELVKAVRSAQEPARASWSEVWAALQIAMRKKQAEAVEFMGNRCGPVASAFVEAEGIERLKYIEFFDPEYGALRIKELQNKWLEFSERSAERVKRGLALSTSARKANGLSKFSVLELASGEAVDDETEVLS